MNAVRGGPLQGVRVVELTKVWAGPCAGKLLAFLGAEVIRIESLNSLDVTRVYGVKDIDNAPGFQAVNPQKLSVQIDMKAEQGIELIRKLLEQSDILVENLRPGAIDRLGLGYAAVKAVRPDIIFVSMSMYGSEGPLAYQTGYAPCFAALGGVSSLVGYAGETPSGMNVRYADSTFGAAAAYAALVALVHRRRMGVGQFIDVSAVETMTSMIGDVALNGVVRACEGNRHADMAPHGVYSCLDNEWLSIAIATDANWIALTQAMGRPAFAERFARLADRKQNEAALDAAISKWTSEHVAADLAAELQKRGVGAERSQSSVNLVADPRLWARELFCDVTNQAGESRTIVGPSWRMSRPAAINSSAPKLGEHNDYVLGELLGLSAAERERLAAAGVTR